MGSIKSKRPKAIIFDLEGVLLRINYQKTFDVFNVLSNGARNIQYNAAFKNLCDAYDRGDITTDEAFHRFKRIYHWPELRFRDFKKAWNAMLLDIPDEVFEYLMRLRWSGVTLILLSNINHLHAVNVVKSYGQEFKNLFDNIFFSYLLGKLKPEEGAYNDVINYLTQWCGIDVTETVFVDDMQANVDVAQKLGIAAKHYPMNGRREGSSYSLRDLLESGGSPNFMTSLSRPAIQSHLQSRLGAPRLVR